MKNAARGLEKSEIVRTAADFNKEEEEKKKAAELAKAKSEKVPKLSKDGRYFCANKGCTKKTFVEEENGDEACLHHSGEPIFHDLTKYWTCCGKKTYDWDDFMALPTCQVGRHAIKYK